MRRLLIIVAYAFLALAVAGLGAYFVVSFMVEKAPEVEVPDVTGLPLNEAVENLSARGIDLEVRDFIFSDEVSENRVVRQRPQAGSIIKAGRAVGVVLSKGTERHFAPDVVGVAEEEAIIALAQLNLSPLTGAKVPGEVAGVVLGQSRVPGTRLGVGESVALLVSSGPEAPLLRMPNLSGLEAAKALEKLSAMGIKVSRVEEMKLGGMMQSGRVLGQEPLAGAPVRKDAEANLSVSAE